MSEADWAVRR